MKSFLKKYLYTFVPFMVLDALWLSTVAAGFYQAQIGFIMTKTPNWLAAILFYVLFIFGMVVFVTGREGNLKQAALRGALFGLVTYATYDLTNLATLAGWPILITLVDLGWGTLASTLTAVVSVWAQQKF